MEKHSLIRTIYLYLFALVGLVLLVIGAVRLLDMGLKAFVFTKAEAEIDYNMKPSISLYPGKTVTEDDFVSAIKKCDEKCELNEEQKQQIESWLMDYKIWQESQKNAVSFRVQSLHREASGSLAFILIGLPLYLYHWRVIKKDIKKVAINNQ